MKRKRQTEEQIISIFNQQCPFRPIACEWNFLVKDRILADHMDYL